jgi:hypothetical protein
VSRALTALAADPAAALRDPHRPRGRPNPGPGARLAGAPRNHGTGAAAPLVIDVDATLVTAHSDRQDATPTNAASGIIRCGRSSTTARPAAGSRCR